MAAVHKQRLILLGIAIISIGLFGLLADAVLTNQLLAIDSTAAEQLYAARTPLLTQVMLGLSWLGYQAVVLTSFGLGLYLLLRQRWSALRNHLVVIGGAGLASFWIKLLIIRPRPELAPLVVLEDYSYPSGHSFMSFVFYASLAIFIWQTHRTKLVRVPFAILAAMIIIGIGISRIYLGVHYPSDVLGGWLAGLTWLSLTMAVLPRNTGFGQK